MVVRPTSCLVLVIVLGTLLFSSCDSDSPVSQIGEIETAGSQVSDCGGFDNMTKRSAGDIPFASDPQTYLDAEKLLWLYDESTGMLSLLDRRVNLNCCGEHAVTAELLDGVVLIREDDQPLDGTGRCKCMCTYDFFIEVTGVPETVITLRLDLTVDTTTVTKWEGDIDLRKGSGEIVIDSKPMS
ncbi:hypothetical protein LLG96_14050 [bacterium]|nr:hypothetical protein [bacterium]